MKDRIIKLDDDKTYYVLENRKLYNKRSRKTRL